MIYNLTISFQIEHVAITFDGGASTMNFAEAALLIQGTACVYSKKVYMQQLHV